MRRIALLGLFVGFLIPLFAAAPAHAQATRTWVSGVGDDVNPCSRTAPCKTFAGAISKTAAGGEINCLDPGGFGTVTITKAMTLNCKETGIGSILAAGVPGITINAGAADRVTLRSLQIQGVNQTPTPGTIGVRILQAATVSIEDCVITAFGQKGVDDVRTGAANNKLFIRNSIISNNTSTGVSAGAGTVSTTVLDGVQSVNNLFGVAAATGNNVLVIRSNLSGNSSAGAIADAGGQILIDSTAVSGNGTGLQANGGGNIRVTNSDITFNTVQAFLGTPVSYGDNRVFGNVAGGTGLSGAGSPSTDLGQQ
jgi:Right handed beta helix region